MSVDLSGRIRVNPEFVKMQPDNVLGGCIAHNLMHLMMFHTARRHSRDAKTWTRPAIWPLTRSSERARWRCPPMPSIRRMATTRLAPRRSIPI